METLVSKALGATARNLVATRPRAMNALSETPRWVYGRRLEVLTRAFTLLVRRESSTTADPTPNF
jgi:hypothetical protein